MKYTMYSFRFMVFSWAVLRLLKVYPVDMKACGVFYSQYIFFVIMSVYVAIQKYTD